MSNQFVIYVMALIAANLLDMLFGAGVGVVAFFLAGVADAISYHLLKDIEGLDEDSGAIAVNGVVINDVMFFGLVTSLFAVAFGWHVLLWLVVGKFGTKLTLEYFYKSG